MMITVGKLKKLLEKYDDKMVVCVTDEIDDNRSVTRLYKEKGYFNSKLNYNSTDDILVITY